MKKIAAALVAALMVAACGGGAGTDGEVNQVDIVVNDRAPCGPGTGVTCE